MTLLQFFFIISAIVIFIIGFDIAKKQRFNALHFLVFLGVGGGLIIFTLFPNILQKVGDIFGVARGADVLVYTGIIFLLYFVLLLLTKHVQNREDITRLVREFAIEKSSKEYIYGREVFVIPCYNEEKVIKNTVQSVLDDGYKNIIVINDGSTDNSENILESFGDKIVILHHFTNRGQGASLETGFEYIRRFGRMEYIVTFDADGQHNVKELENFMQAFKKDESLQVVLGSRFIGTTKSNVPLVRRCLLKLSIIFTFIISKIALSDSHNGYRVFKLNTLGVLRITQDGMSHASEIIDIIAIHKLKYQEVPVTIRYNDYSLGKGQKSSNAIAIAMRVLWSKFFR